jgi:crotonobetainyl-CoA:carnitine CoA-transferase CaiB-like acyl-CoA transferase
MGPFATQILAELGADVIKVEPQEGDNARHAGPMRSPGMGYLFLNLNRGKRGIVLDLKRFEGREALMRLIRGADVLIYNVRPQAMARLGLSYESVHAVNPRVLYVGTYGYSQRGPYAGKAAYDDLIQGATAIPWLASRTGGDAPHYAPLNLADRLTGLHAVYAVTSALFHRERTGQGQAIEVPMFESVAHFVLGDHSAGLTYDPPIPDTAYTRLLARRPYATRDGYICVLVYNDKQWKGFCGAIGRPDMLADERYSTQANRARNVAEFYDVVAEIMKTRTTAEWMALLETADIPVSRMNSIEDVFHDPHLAASAFFATENHPSEARLMAPRTPTHWSLSQPGAPRPAPGLGEHSAEVLREAGYSNAEIADLARLGVTLLAP